MIEFLKEYGGSGITRFHMPGHKGKLQNMEFSKWIPQIDITEIEGSDNLHRPEGVIGDGQKRASKFFGSKETLFLVNGSTSGIYTAIMATLKPGEKALIQRNSHKSVYNGAMLGDIELEYLYPEYSQDLELLLGVDADKLESRLSKGRDIEAVFITSPSYYGIVPDIERISDIAHRYGAILIVDEAHGSHLSLDEELPPSAIGLGADIVIQSTHKTLLGYTQSAMVHICSDRVDMDRVREVASLHQSTSPSYILMASLANTVSYLENKAKYDFSQYMKYLRNIREEISNIEGLRLIDKTMVGGFKYDDTRLVFSIRGLSGAGIEERLRKKNIELEMSDEKYGLAISTLADSEEDLRKLFKALEEIAGQIEPLDKKRVVYSRPPAPERVWSIREAFFMDKEKVDLKDSVGKISGKLISPYPPGIPILVPGEKISLEMADYIERLLAENIDIVGIDRREIEIIRGGK